MNVLDEAYLGRHKKFRIDKKKLTIAFPLIAFIVALIVFWWLKLIGITITGEILCEVPEHTHAEACYTQELICGYDEQKESTTLKIEEETSYEATTMEESTGCIHEHNDACYKKTLVCDIEEHQHSSACYPDIEADTEKSSDWMKTIEDVKFSNSVSDNLVTIATTQIGYAESKRNFEIDSDGNRNAYTRYGEWYGNPYCEWNTAFVSFCLNYSMAQDVTDFVSAGAETMRLAWRNAGLYVGADEGVYERGSIAFFDTDSDGAADRVGVVNFCSDKLLLLIEGDVDGVVATTKYEDLSQLMGYALTSGLTVSDGVVQYSVDYSEDDNTQSTSAGQVVMMSASNKNSNADITYTSHLEGEVVGQVIKTQFGEIIGDGSTVYIGEVYEISLEFSEINTGSTWIQFAPDEDGCLTYHIPSNIHCQPFDSWHPISAKTENGTIEDVGEYFIDENGLLKVKFFEDANNENFVDLYSNVDFTITFSATIGDSQAGSSTEIVFSDQVKVNFDKFDGGASFVASKTHGEFDNETNTMDYTIRIEATHGVVKDFWFTDDIWANNNHHALRDTIVVTDLDGNVLDPQPTVADCTLGSPSGFSMTGFPDFSAGNGYYITYKTKINDESLDKDIVDLWNGLTAYGSDSNGKQIKEWTEDWTQVMLKKLKKTGKQASITDENGNAISVIEWNVIISKNSADLEGTLIIDTLGDGLEYYTGKQIFIRRKDATGAYLGDVYLDWNNVNITGNSMSFDLPPGYAFEITYYTTHEAVDAGEQKQYSNNVTANINGKTEGTSGSADVVGFVPRAEKTAYGNDGQYVYYTIEADVPGFIKNWGNFMISDYCAFWNAGLHVENKPVDLVITATTQSGNTITFTPYVAGGPTENTYIVISPGMYNEAHNFQIYFNTYDPTSASSKWILDEDSVLNITYKIPFDAKTGTEINGELTGDKTVGDVLLENYVLNNELYLSYTDTTSVTASANYQYSAKITKKAIPHEDGTIDYTVTVIDSAPLYEATEIFFTDTFDERLEYVPGSLTVTCYNPWTPTLWTNKYVYHGNITGNSIHVNANDFIFSEVSSNSGFPDTGWLSTLSTYYIYTQNNTGKNVFSYKLKVKDEYLYSTDHAVYELDNTADVIWSNGGTFGPITETIEYETGLLDKSMIEKDSKLEFDLHINRNALDILPDSDTITIHDTMTQNLSVYWSSIVLLYEDENGNWIDFHSDESDYDYTVTYDQVHNKLTFVIPDSLHIRIDYTTLITEAGYVSINNSVRIEGKAEVTDVVDAVFRVDEHSGGASGSNNQMALIKHDGTTFVPLSGATFLLYGPMGDSSAILPNGASASITAYDGSTLRYIGTYTTGADGSIIIKTQYLTIGGPYALVETVAPEGYNLLDEPAYFYFYEKDPNGIAPTVTTLLSVENYTYGFVFPETGGAGILPTAIIGAALIAYPVLYSSIRRKRERRLS